MPSKDGGKEAIAAYRKAVSAPHLPEPRGGLCQSGWAYLNLGKPREAEESYRAAVQLQPRFAQAYYFLGVVLDRQGRKDEAKAAFRTARDLDPDSPFGQKAGISCGPWGKGDDSPGAHRDGRGAPCFPLTPFGVPS